MKSLFLIHILQNMLVDWFGEISLLGWLFIFGVSATLQAIPFFIYLASLRGHLERNRNPSILRWFCLSFGATLLFGSGLLFFRQAHSWIVFLGLFIILLILSVILFISGRKSTTA